MVLLRRARSHEGRSLFSDADNTPTTVEGSGQMVYWRDCFILVYKTGHTDKPVEEHSKCDGEGLVQKGISLWFGGRNGQVKEGV
ncbi:hypothetical protein BKA61DRAFT_665796 [Leptodontidium sp. MPI-SDFR-AT-0119]|nr:hypothetical protein BKA61DRAFT_665796 [Leptodontidium sp. MPI-SDFR-AT-0119]